MKSPLPRLLSAATFPSCLWLLRHVQFSVGRYTLREICCLTCCCLIYLAHCLVFLNSVQASPHLCHTASGHHLPHYHPGYQAALWGQGCWHPVKARRRVRVRYRHGREKGAESRYTGQQLAQSGSRRSHAEGNGTHQKQQEAPQLYLKG